MYVYSTLITSMKNITNGVIMKPEKTVPTNTQSELTINLLLWETM